MDNAELYNTCNIVSRKDAEMALKEFAPRLTWTEYENILDVGCGSGNVTMDILRPKLPSSARIVGVDKSSKMVEFANKKYSLEQVHFIVLDFSTKNITDVFVEEQFSKIFSFYCIHWIKDLEQVSANIRTLLQPGGEFLITTLNSNMLFHMYKTMSKMDEWKTYMKDVENFIPRFQDSADTCEEIRKLLTSEGLEVVICEKRNRTITFPNMKACMQLYEAVDPFVKRMSEHTREQYMACFEQLMKDHGLIVESQSGQILEKYLTIVLYGKRPGTVGQI